MQTCDHVHCLLVLAAGREVAGKGVQQFRAVQTVAETILMIQSMLLRNTD